MANIFLKMSPGIATMASTDKSILVYDVSSLKRGIFCIQTQSRIIGTVQILAYKSVCFG